MREALRSVAENLIEAGSFTTTELHAFLILYDAAGEPSKAPEEPGPVSPKRRPKTAPKWKIRVAAPKGKPRAKKPLSEAQLRHLANMRAKRASKAATSAPATLPEAGLSHPKLLHLDSMEEQLARHTAKKEAIPSPTKADRAVLSKLKKAARSIASDKKAEEKADRQSEEMGELLDAYTKALDAYLDNKTPENKEAMGMASKKMKAHPIYRLGKRSNPFGHIAPLTAKKNPDLFKEGQQHDAKAFKKMLLNLKKEAA